MDNFPRWADHLLALLVGIVIPVMTIYRYNQGALSQKFDTALKKQLYISSSLSLFILAVITVAVWLLFGRSLTQMGFRLPGNDKTYWWLVIAFVLLYSIETVGSVITPDRRNKAILHWEKRTSFLPTRIGELPLYLLMCFSAGVFEELVFRGFLVTYCYYLFSGLPYQMFWAVLFPSLIFSVSHYYQGSRAVFKILVLSFLFGYIFTLSGSLLVVMVLHFLVDAVGGLLTMWLMKDENEIEIR
jgi:membrane protease YdiL (CAAX protease family)